MKSGEKRLFLVILVIALALTGAALYPVWQQQREAAKSAVQEVHIPRAQAVGDARHSRGPANAPFVLVEFADFTCTHCAEAAPYIDGLISQHPNDLRHIFRCLPVERHPSARICQAAAEAAGLQGRFWEMLTGLFAKRGEKTDDEVESAARAAGLNMDRYHKDLSSARLSALADQDLAAADALGVTTTPTFYFFSPQHTYRVLGGGYLKSFLSDRSHWR